eukprot:TRINITY_DN5320_c0_g2_i1.p5 TRINITY_DN5320_c0_g2~~TRINITY_DN5320_c0_g2_i1.p5  ORF type:complete len:100 (-),score=0.74 TRINITY_DN5320_c0_g2_i1:931-1230(-)
MLFLELKKVEVIHFSFAFQFTIFGYLGKQLGKFFSLSFKNEFEVVLLVLLFFRVDIFFVHYVQKRYFPYQYIYRSANNNLNLDVKVLQELQGLRIGSLK